MKFRGFPFTGETEFQMSEPLKRCDACNVYHTESELTYSKEASMWLCADCKAEEDLENRLYAEFEKANAKVV